MGASTKLAASVTDVLIDIRSDRAKSLSLEKRLPELLRHVPPEHLVGLGRISAVDRFSERGHADALAVYHRLFQRERAVVELSVPNIFKNTQGSSRGSGRPKPLGELMTAHVVTLGEILESWRPHKVDRHFFRHAAANDS